MLSFERRVWPAGEKRYRLCRTLPLLREELEWVNFRLLFFVAVWTMACNLGDTNEMHFFFNEMQKIDRRCGVVKANRPKQIRNDVAQTAEPGGPLITHRIPLNVDKNTTNELIGRRHSVRNSLARSPRNLFEW